MNKEINAVLAYLQEGKSNKTQQTLANLHALLAEYTANGGQDYSTTTIGKLCQEKGVISYNSLRVKASQHYRELIKAWAEQAGKTVKKPAKSVSSRSSKDYDLLDMVNDLALKAAFGQIIRERDRAKSELNALKGQTDFVVNLNDNVVSEPTPPVEFMPSMSGVLSEPELNILKSLIDKDWQKDGFEVGARGNIKHPLIKGDLLPRGFIKVVAKLVEAIDG